MSAPGLHDDRCATWRGHPCNCASAAFDHLRPEAAADDKGPPLAILMLAAAAAIGAAVASSFGYLG